MVVLRTESTEYERQHVKKTVVVLRTVTTAYERHTVKKKAVVVLRTVTTANKRLNVLHVTQKELVDTVNMFMSTHDIGFTLIVFVVIAF